MRASRPPLAVLRRRREAAPRGRRTARLNGGRRMLTPTKESKEKLEAEVGGRDEFLTLHEIVVAARHKLTRNIWDYLIGGVETETTLARNRLALDSIAFRPRVLCDVSDIDSTSTFFGKKVRLPVALAPVGGLESFDPEGGVTVARAAAEFGVPMFLSSASQPGLEPVSKVNGGIKV